MKMIETSADKAKVTLAIRAYIAAAAQMKAAKAEADKRRDELLAVMDGDTSVDWNTDDGRKYHLAATYGKSSKNLNADLIKAVLGVDVTDACYKVSKSWNEIRVTIVA